MDRTIKTEKIPTEILKHNPKLVEEIKLKQRIDLFKEIPIADNQPVVLTFRSMDETSMEHFNTTLTTTIEVQYPEMRHIVINKCIGENYTEHISFWSKLKLLFSKKSIYTREIKEA
jgi:hypothetical protein